ncbi:MAG TPA: hypothetical protein VK126_01520 [Nitrososphaerales archaeon]|nr:hypothetical protein [Nitrososphaerales archaeon]
MSRVKAQAFPDAYLEVDQSPKRSLSVTAASFLFLVFGSGSVLADPLLLAYVAYYHAAPVLPLIGDVLDDSTPIGVAGGLNAVIVLGIGLVVLSVLDVVAGLWLRHSLKKGRKLGIILQPFNLFFAYGFGIPALYVLAPLWLILIVLGWKRLR